MPEPDKPRDVGASVCVTSPFEFTGLRGFSRRFGGIMGAATMTSPRRARGTLLDAAQDTRPSSAV